MRCVQYSMCITILCVHNYALQMYGQCVYLYMYGYPVCTSICMAILCVPVYVWLSCVYIIMHYKCLYDVCPNICTDSLCTSNYALQQYLLVCINHVHMSKATTVTHYCCVHLYQCNASTVAHQLLCVYLCLRVI